ncbi:BhlA/UviB family holin-like peptide [Brevibacillus formosus]|uniref:BhlA/UviB family holin-like peptide n=1 Tax=Brevibacillus formosus TaxID=54913 RepID=UPI003F1C26A5
MEESIFKLLLTQGPFAALFVWLLFSTKKESKEREIRLQETLDKFASKYDLIIERLDRLDRKG